MSNQLVDKEFQKSLKITGLFEHPGWEDFEEKLLDLLGSYEYKIQDLTSKQVKEEKREELNYLIAIRNALREVLLLKEELLEDVNKSPLEDGA